MKTSITRKSWKDITIAVWELRGLIQTSGGPDTLWREISGFQKALRDKVDQWGGEILEFVGSSAMVIFGHRRAQRHRIRALTCLVELAEMGVEFQPLYFAAGVDSGQVVIGEEKEGKANIVGPALEGAQLLLSQIEREGVAVTASLRKEVGQKFRFRQIKRASKLWLLVGKGDTSISIYPSRQEFFPRKKEFDELINFALKKKGVNGLCVIRGESGLGKSYFIGRLADELEGRGWRVFSLLEKKAISSQNVNYPGKEIFWEELQNLANGNKKENLQVLFIDDWDRLSPEFQGKIEPLLSSPSFLSIVTTSTPLAIPSTTSDLEIALPFFTNLQTTRFLKERMPSEGFPPSYLQSLCRLSQGNPSVAQALYLDSRHSFPSLPPLSKTLRQLFLDRINSHPHPYQMVLRLVALAGLQSPIFIFHHIYQGQEGVKSQALQLFQSQKIIHLEEKKISFTTRYWWQAIYESILKRHRQRVHREISRLVQATGKKVSPLYLVDHLIRGEERKRAREYIFEEMKKWENRGQPLKALWWLEQVRPLLAEEVERIEGEIERLQNKISAT